MPKIEEKKVEVVVGDGNNIANYYLFVLGSKNECTLLVSFVIGVAD